MDSEKTPTSIAELFDRAGALAHERLRETWGDELVDRLIADPKANVRVIFDLSMRYVAITVRWPAMFGEDLKIACRFEVLEARN